MQDLIEKLTAMVDRTDHTLDEIEKRLKDGDERFSKIEARLEEGNKRFERMDKNISVVQYQVQQLCLERGIKVSPEGATPGEPRG